MPVLFNPIAFEAALGYGPQFELGGEIVARTLSNAVHCPCCGAAYNLLVPAAASPPEVEAYTLDLRSALGESCGMHPPFVQMQ